MVKKISVSLSDYVYDMVGNVYNRSRYVEECILKSYELTTGEWSSLKEKYALAIKDNRHKDDEIKKLKSYIGKLKQKLGDYADDEEQIKVDQFARAIRDQGLARELGR